jgi:SAM-dependent methyltransferase
MQINKQEIYFRNKDHQYSTRLVTNPPLHNNLELQYILDYINKNHRNELIVDFGAGTGRLSISLLKANYNVLAIDISKSSLDQLKVNAKIIGKSKFIKTYYSLGKNKHSIICGTDILHHINLEDYFRFFFANLTQNGSIIFSEPNCLNPAWVFVISLFSNWKIEAGIFQCSYFNIKNKLRSAGFSQIQITGLGLFPLPLFNWSRTLSAINLLAGNLPILKLFAYRYIISARK